MKDRRLGSRIPIPVSPAPHPVFVDADEVALLSEEELDAVISLRAYERFQRSNRNGR